MNGATAVPCVRTTKPPRKIIASRRGAIQNFFLALRNAQYSWRKLNICDNDLVCDRKKRAGFPASDINYSHGLQDRCRYRLLLSTIGVSRFFTGVPGRAIHGARQHDKPGLRSEIQRFSTTTLIVTVPPIRHAARRTAE